jgi:2-oxopent-4-enoate hydratase
MTLYATADLLFDAEQQARAVPPPTATGPLTLDEAYAIQQHNVRRRVALGERLVGRKVGITSVAVQSWLKVNEPDFGALFASMIIPDGGSCPVSALIQPRVEAEVAFVLGADLPSADPTTADVVRATDHVCAAIEIIDSRVADWKITLEDTVADNASSARFVLATQKTPLTGLALPTAGCALRKNGRVASTGAGAACLGDPVHAVVWLARTLALRGTPLVAGDIVLSGALGPVVPVAAGDHIEADVAHVGRCSVRFT